MAQRVLITGITGQDGSYLAEQALAAGCEVVGVVRPGSVAPAGVAAITADLGDVAALRRAVDEVRPDQLYHLAAPTFVPDSWKDPDGVRAQIVDATEALLRAAGALAQPPRVFVATSAEIFGNAGVSPQNEDAPKHPRTPYGEAKLAAHQLVGALRDELGLFAVSGITFNHESPRRPERFLPRKVTRGVAAIALGQADQLELGALDAVRDWSHAADIMRGARLALAVDEPSDYVFASGVGRTVADLVAAAFAAADLGDPEPYLRINPAFVRPPEETAPVGDPTRARTLLGWVPEIGFDAMIAEMVQADLAELG